MSNERDKVIAERAEESNDLAKAIVDMLEQRGSTGVAAFVALVEVAAALWMALSKHPDQTTFIDRCGAIFELALVQAQSARGRLLAKAFGNSAEKKGLA